MGKRKAFTPLEISRIQKVPKFQMALLTGFTLIVSVQAVLAKLSAVFINDGTGMPSK